MLFSKSPLPCASCQAARRSWGSLPVGSTCPPCHCLPQLPPPAAHGRAAAKTHLPTDEAALRQLQHLSPLPGLVIQHRALQASGMSSVCSISTEKAWGSGPGRVEGCKHKARA